MAEPTDISTFDLAQWCYDHMAAAVVNHGEWTSRVYPEADEAQARAMLDHRGYEVSPRYGLDAPGCVSIRVVSQAVKAANARPAPRGGA